MQDDEVKVTQADRDLWKRMCEAGDNGAYEDEALAMLAHHRQQAEDAMREWCAAYVEGKGGVIPATTVFISLITGERMPCMSGDGRDKLNPHKRRYFDDATRGLATAIRAATLSKEVE